jgi:hypothetical protein
VFDQKHLCDKIGQWSEFTRCSFLSSTFPEISNFICGGVRRGHGDLYIFGSLAPRLHKSSQISAGTFHTNPHSVIE